MIPNVSVPDLTSVLDIDDRALVIFDRDGFLSYANQQATVLLDKPANDLIGKSELDFAANLRWAHLAIPLRAAREGRVFSGDVRPVFETNGWHVRCTPLAEGTSCQFHRIGNPDEDYNEQHLYDSLTALPNRHLFFKRLTLRLEQARQQTQPFCIACFDLDRFKWLNDTLGHSAGDALLVAFVRRLVQNLPKDTLIARLGGDEFAIAFPLGTSQVTGIHQLSDILINLMRAYTINGRRVALSISAGMVAFPTATAAPVSADLLIDLADFALRRAKTKGRGRINVIDDQGVYDFERQRGLVKWLHKAVSRKSFKLHYQPLVSSRDSKVTAVEALLRPLPGLSHVTIPEIIDLAGNEGLMPSLGQWILETACQQLAAWRRSGLNVGINVNLAPAQLLSTSFIADTLRLLRENDLKPPDITFEISESLAVSEEITVASTIEHMLENDFRLSIDDFGIEYASIGRVARMPIHQVKFDRSLVTHLGNGSRQSTMVSGLMSLIASDDLGLSVVAEGVETPSSREGAVAAGAELLQGFAVHRPMPAEEVVRII